MRLSPGTAAVGSPAVAGRRRGGHRSRGGVRRSLTAPCLEPRQNRRPVPLCHQRKGHPLCFRGSELSGQIVNHNGAITIEAPTGATEGGGLFGDSGLFGSAGDVGGGLFGE